jgi:AcrR family transcriptional regulator
MTDQSNDTKIKIMEAARVLFASQGFEGTSIREIAKAAEVNLASVNYHFNNKEKLFTEILHRGYSECSEHMREFYNSHHPTLEEALVHLFHYFLNKSHDLVSYFKMMMSAQHSHNMAAQGTEDEHLGPPGAKVITEALIKEIGPHITEEDVHWAIKSLFSHVTHIALMYSCCFKDNQLPFTKIPDLEKNLRRLCRVVIKELKEKV